MALPVALSGSGTDAEPCQDPRLAAIVAAWPTLPDTLKDDLAGQALAAARIATAGAEPSAVGVDLDGNGPRPSTLPTCRAPVQSR